MTVQSRHVPLGVAVFPSFGPLSNPHVREVALLLAAVALLALSAQVSWTPPFSNNRAGEPVPVTGQTFGVLFLAASLGLRRGTLAVLAYLAVGGAGLPVFSSANSGLSYLFTGSTSGYLWGFLAAAAVVGFLADRGFDRGPWLYASLLLGNALVYVVGLPVLKLWLNRHDIPADVWHAGLWPFITGDLFKIALVATLLPAAWWMAGDRGSSRR